MASEKGDNSPYHPVANDEEASNSSTLFLPKQEWTPPQLKGIRVYVSIGYLWLIHGWLLATYLVLAIKYLQAPKDLMDLCRSQTPNFNEKNHLSDGFYSPTDAPIMYEQKTIRTTFNNETKEFLNPYGGKGPDIDEKWEKFLGVGIIKLTEEEATRLYHTPAKLYGGNPGEHAGFLEVVHQLHCLNRIRTHFYDPARNLDGNAGSEFVWNHDQHCFDYLRQNLLCYADTSILPIGWDPKQQAYYSTFDMKITKQCRNFDKIYEWAKGRQTEFIPPGNGGVDLMISNSK